MFRMECSAVSCSRLISSIADNRHGRRSVQITVGKNRNGAEQDRTRPSAARVPSQATAPGCKERVGAVFPGSSAPGSDLEAIEGGNGDHHVVQSALVIILYIARVYIRLEKWRCGGPCPKTPVEMRKSSTMLQGNSNETVGGPFQSRGPASTAPPTAFFYRVRLCR
jgi:hypothetical protein